MDERKIDIAVTAFNTTPEGTLEFDNGKVKTLDKKEFGKAFLMDRVLNQNVRNAMAKENTSRNSGMDR